MREGEGGQPASAREPGRALIHRERAGCLREAAPAPWCSARSASPGCRSAGCGRSWSGGPCLPAGERAEDQGGPCSGRGISPAQRPRRPVHQHGRVTPAPSSLASGRNSGALRAPDGGLPPVRHRGVTARAEFAAQLRDWDRSPFSSLIGEQVRADVLRSEGTAPPSDRNDALIADDDLDVRIDRWDHRPDEPSGAGRRRHRRRVRPHPRSSSRGASGWRTTSARTSRVPGARDADLGRLRRTGVIRRWTERIRTGGQDGRRPGAGLHDRHRASCPSAHVDARDQVSAAAGSAPGTPRTAAGADRSC
jgi:hypothetical protein